MVKNIIGVAVGKGPSGLQALRYAVEDEEILEGGDMMVFLLHVYPPVRWVIGPLGDRVRAEHASAATIKKFKDERNRKAEKLINQYKSICDNKKVKTEVRCAEGEEVQKELVELISKLGLTKLVLGTSKKNLLSRALKGESIATYVAKNAPNFCTVIVISKGKIISVTDAMDSSSISPSSDTSSIRSEFRTEDDALSEYGGTRSDEAPYSQIGFSPMDYLMNPTTEWIIPSIPHTRNENNRLSNPPIVPMIDTGSSHGSHSLEAASYQDIYVVPDPQLSRGHSKAQLIHQMSSHGRIDAVMGESVVAHSVELLEKELTEAKMSVEWAQREAEQQSKSITNAERIVVNAKKMITEAENKRNNALKDAQMAKLQSLEDARRLEEAIVALQKSLKEQEIFKKNSKITIDELTSRLDAYEKDLNITQREAERVTERYREALTKLEELTKALEIESQKRKDAERRAVEEFLAKQEALKALRKLQQKYTEYTFEELKAATDDFDENNKLGEGGYGPVYKGKLLHTPVAIKVLAREGVHGREEFQREVELLSHIHHPHLVMLLGACPKEACIVYEYMSNGSLEDCLKGKGGRPPLPWYVRFRICFEVATALFFLHSRPEPIAHRDLKPGNILLDHNYVSKIGDVGIAKLVPPKNDNLSYSITMYKETVLMGTLAYMDPDYQRTGVVSCECDVYALGIVMLQLLTGRPPLGVAVLVEDAIDNNRLVDILDKSAGDWPIEDAKALADLSLECMEPRRKHRPSLEMRVLPFLEELWGNADCVASKIGCIGSSAS